MDTEMMRELAKKMMMRGIDAADPERLVDKNVNVDDHTIRIGKNDYTRNDYDEVLVFGVGKASVSMASALKRLKPDGGLMITKKGQMDEDHHCPVTVKEAEHPYPEEVNLRASEELLDRLEGIKNALIIFLISGGGSALFFYPVEGISVSEMNELNRLLVKSGANIHEMNAVRKHLSKVKGGRFAQLCEEKGDLVSLIISDVVGNDLSAIASGPTSPDHSTFHDAVGVLKDYGLWKDVPKPVKDHLEKGVRGEVPETPTEVHVDNNLIGDNFTTLSSAEITAEKKGFNTMILTSQNQGEAREVAKPLAAIAKEIQDTNNPLEPPAAVIVGGETTVSFENEENDHGKGGPNRELVLSAAVEISGRKNIVVASVDSDGIDGMDKAGAIADCNSVDRSTFKPKKLLKQHDSQRFFDELNDSIEFESRTNVNDITVLLVGE
ncbi:MAG: glycerate kinase [Candidatus Aenigmatarchaeota archaeon]